MKNISYLAGAAAGMLIASLASAVEPLRAAEGTGGFNAGCHHWHEEGASKHSASDDAPLYKNMHVIDQAGLCNTHDLVD